MLLPYLELPVCIGYAQSEESKIVVGKFQPSQISAYHEGFMPEVGMFIYVGPNVFQIGLTITEYERRIQEYWKLVTGKQDVKSKLGMIH